MTHPEDSRHQPINSEPDFSWLGEPLVGSDDFLAASMQSAQGRASIFDLRRFDKLSGPFREHGAYPYGPSQGTSHYDDLAETRMPRPASLKNKLGSWMVGAGLVAAAVGGSVYLVNEDNTQAERVLAERQAAFEPILQPAAERIAFDILENTATIGLAETESNMTGGVRPIDGDPNSLEIYYQVRQPDGGAYHEVATVGKDAAGNPDVTQVTGAEIRITGPETDSQPRIRDIIDIAAAGEGLYEDPEYAYWNLSRTFSSDEGKTPSNPTGG